MSALINQLEGGIIRSTLLELNIRSIKKYQQISINYCNVLFSPYCHNSIQAEPIVWKLYIPS
jgi:hypothetical protein